jgi:hypothetical protein
MVGIRPQSGRSEPLRSAGVASRACCKSGDVSPRGVSILSCRRDLRLRVDGDRRFDHCAAGQLASLHPLIRFGRSLQREGLDMGFNPTCLGQESC